LGCRLRGESMARTRSAVYGWRASILWSMAKSGSWSVPLRGLCWPSQGCSRQPCVKAGRRYGPTALAKKPSQGGGPNSAAARRRLVALRLSMGERRRRGRLASLFERQEPLVWPEVVAFCDIHKLLINRIL
jgi:hypothetical protein